MQLMLCNPSPRVVRLLERSGIINKIGREHIHVRVHDAVVSCQQSLIQMEGGGLGPAISHSLSAMWQPVNIIAASDASDDPSHLPVASPRGTGGGVASGAAARAAGGKDASRK
jgi:hypothetical protein